MEKLFATILKIDAFWRRFGRILSIFGGGVLFLMTLIVVSDVSGRYLFNNPIKGAVEALELLLPYVAFLALAYALVTGTHIRVTLILDHLPHKLRLWSDTFACVVGLFFLGMLSYAGWFFFWRSFAINEFMMAEIYLPWWVGKFAMPVGLFVFLTQFLLRLLVNLGRLANKINSVEVATEQIEAV